MPLFFPIVKISSINNGSNINSGNVVINTNKYNFRISTGDNSMNMGDGIIILQSHPDLSKDFSNSIDLWDSDLAEKTGGI